MISDECLRQDELLNAVLDGERPADELWNEHVEVCGRCEAHLYFMPNLTLPAIRTHALVEPIWCDSVLRAARPRSYRKLHAAIGVLAACVLLAIGKLGTKDLPPSRLETAAAPPQAVLLPVEAMDSRTALATLQQGWIGQVTMPKPALSLPTVSPLEADAQPAGETLAALPESARAGLEPIAGTTRRAFSLFLRELPNMPREATTTP